MGQSPPQSSASAALVPRRCGFFIFIIREKILFLRSFFSIYIFMNINKLIFSIAASCIFSLGCAQCPDSVQVYVDPEVICPGEIAHLSTDSLLLHCVNIGDIICVTNFDDGSHDTIIVSPNDWTRLSQDHNLTALSIVFYVDSTCKHGWAVKAESYQTKQWKTSPSPDNFPTRQLGIDACRDLDGYANTQQIHSATYPAAYYTQDPFYLPAFGQLNYLFVQRNILNMSLQSINNNFKLPQGNWWSSTCHQTISSAIYLDIKTGESQGQIKLTSYYVLPVMNF